MAVELTEAAAGRVRHYMAQRPAAIGLRVALKPSGCSGFKYVVELTDSLTADDTVFESNGVKLIIDRGDLPRLDGTRIDFTRSGLNEAFRYDNPNVKSLCGCGESVSV